MANVSAKVNTIVAAPVSRITRSFTADTECCARER
jgi:hypothetical protein